MKRLIITLLLVFSLTACSSEELPPGPPPVGGSGYGQAVAGLAGAMPNWAAPARNLVATPAQGFYGDNIIISASNYDYIYKNAYIFNSQVRVWEKTTLQGDAVQDWLRGQAIGGINLDPTKFKEGDNYLVVYACNKSGEIWECNDRKWMLLGFKVNAKAGAIPELAYVNQFLINSGVPPFAIMGVTAEKDNFTETGKTVPVADVIRYDARYRESGGLTVLVHVFDFKNRQELESALVLFKEIINQGWKEHNGHNLAVFLDESDYRVAVWSSGKQIVYVETHKSDSANKEIIDAYLRKYPSDLKKQ